MPPPPPAVRRWSRQRAQRSAQTQATPEDAVAPGLHRSQSGSPVVWWIQRRYAYAQRHSAACDNKNYSLSLPRSSENIAGYAKWLKTGAPRWRSGKRPSVAVQTMTELSQAAEQRAGEGRRADH